jgi:hypothetical protein
VLLLICDYLRKSAANAFAFPDPARLTAISRDPSDFLPLFPPFLCVSKVLLLICDYPRKSAANAFCLS